MKKIRYIPYGYTMRDGRTIVDREEAEVIRYIFDQYIKGASLKQLAEELTQKQVPYTEKTSAWDKARIARIIDNSRYTGLDEYDPIIDEDIYDEAVLAKALRTRNHTQEESEAIGLLRTRVRCARCGALMERRICSKRKIKESWTCTDPACGIRVRISDTDLLMKVTTVINRIIRNADLMIPKTKQRYVDPPKVTGLQNEINEELQREYPSEELIITKVQEIAGELYRNTQAPKQIAARIARQRAARMVPTETFSCAYFLDLIEYILLGADGEVTAVTKTENQVTEGE